MLGRITTPPVLALLVLTAPASLAGQIRASERGVVGQTIDGTTITVDYSRPKVRGRANIYGGVIPWGKIWTPGANWATSIEVSKDVTIDGHPIPAGEYSVWFEVQPDRWTAIFDPRPHRFHLFPPEPGDDQLRFTVIPEDGPHAEMLTWAFEDVTPSGGLLRFAWGERTVAFDIDVAPSREIGVSEEFARRFTGTYELAHGAPLGGRTVRFDVRYANGRLEATWEGAPNPRLTEIWLIHIGSDVFFPAETRDGELVDMLVDLVFEFSTDAGGRATGFELRALDDELWGTAERAD